MKTRLFILLFFHCACILIHTFSYGQIQQPNLTFDRISVEQGLSQSAVRSIIQDHKGFMWFGTHNGLNRYDGNNFIVYKHSEADTNSLLDSDIRYIHEDKNGNLWIASRAGLDRFNVETEIFTHYNHIEDNPNSLSNNTINSIYEDNNEELWIATIDGLNRLDKSRKQFKIYKNIPGDNQSINNNWVTSVLEDSYGVIWVGTSGGLNKFDKKTEKFVNYGSSWVNWVTSIYEDDTHNLWTSTISGLNKFVRNENKFIKVGKEKTAEFMKEGTPSEATIVGDASNRLWMGTGNGIISYDKVADDFIRYKNDPQNVKSLSHNNVISLAIDKSGSLWIGTFGGGINKLNLNSSKFINYQHETNNKQSIQSTSVRAICKDNDGILWIGGYGGMDKINSKTSFIKHYVSTKLQKKKYNLYTSDVYVITQDADNSDILWIGYEGGGISKFSKKTEQFIHYSNSVGQSYGNNILAIYDGKNGFIWMGTSNGLYKLNKQTLEVVSYRNDLKNKNSLSDNDVKAIIKDKTGILWIATSTGLNSFDEKTNTFTRYLHNAKDINSISDNRVISIYEDSSGNLWLGTRGGGLNMFDRKQKLFKRYNEGDGLPNDVIYAILEDNDKNLWLSTNNGISKFSQSSNTFKNFYYNDGLQSDEFNHGAYYRSKSGEMFFGGINGVSSFYPQKIKESHFMPPIILTAFKKFNSDFKFSKNISYADQIELSYKDRVISFEYAALDFTFPQKNQYAYMMEGFDKDWTYSGNKHEVTYTNLDPGKYVFRVKGTNSDGLWNEQGTSIKINIIPPFWQTWWFRLLALLMTVGAIYVLFRFRVRNIKKQNILLEKQVLQRTKELSEINKELEKLSIVARETANGVFITDAKGNVEWFNEGFSKLFGWESVEEYKRQRGKNIREVSGSKNINNIIEECVRDKKSISYESINPTKDGRELWIQATLTPVFDENGNLKKMVFVDADVTELKKAKETAERALEIQEQFLANTSHEIRTPMNGVIGMTRQLLETPLTKEQTEYLNAIKESSNNLLHVVNDILDISKIRAGKIVFEKTEFRLVDLFKTLQFVLQYRAEEKNIYLKTFIDEELPPVLIGDPIRLNQILLNLAGNAIKFTDKGGVTFSIKKMLQKNNQVTIEFCVTDTGIGIAKDKLDYVFESFTQAESHTTRKYGGTGLGLSISKSLVEQQGGRIFISSELGHGSSFCFELTFEIGNPESKGVIIQTIEGIPHNVDLSDIHVLVVDDNKINQRVALFELNKWKVKAEATDTAKDAFEKITFQQANGVNYNLILMDISMPGMDGLEATRYIRSNFQEPIKNIPIIAMTASALTGEKERCYDAGMNDYISKPFNPVSLYSKIIKWSKKEEKEVLIIDPIKISSKKENNKPVDLSLLREHAAGDIEYIKEMITVYMSNMPVYVDEMNTYLNEQNWKEVALQAHKMKSPAALFGVSKLKEVLSQIEVNTNELVEQHKIKDLVQNVNESTMLSIEELKIELNKITSQEFIS